LKIIPHHDIALKWPNLRVMFAVGKLNRGGMRTPDGVRSRRPDEEVVPEYGIRMVDANGSVRYIGCPDRRLTFAGWEESSGVWVPKTYATRRYS
jgi:hypothetical protein